MAAGERVLIIDADPVNRSLSAMVAPEAAVGLMEVLAGKVRFNEALAGSGASGFQALPMAVTSKVSRYRPSRAAVERLITYARARFDYVLFVGAPLRDEPDARAIAEAVDQVALVLKAGSTTRGDVASALRALRIRGEKTCGIVLTMAGKAVG